VESASTNLIKRQPHAPERARRSSRPSRTDYQQVNPASTSTITPVIRLPAPDVSAHCYIHCSLKQAVEFSDGLPELSDEIDGAENPGRILSQTSDLRDQFMRHSKGWFRPLQIAR
jgi:hypothetical protein